MRLTKKFISLSFFILLISIGKISLCSEMLQNVCITSSTFEPIAHELKIALFSISGKNLSLEEIDFTELKGGMSSTKLYAFELCKKKYVLRVLNHRYSLEDRAAEIQAHKIGSQLKMAPELVFIDQNSRFIIMPFIKGHTLTKKDLHNDALIQTLGKMLSQLHSHKEELPRIRLQIERIKNHYENAIKKEIAFPSTYVNLYTDYIAESYILNKSDQVLSHADLNSANILISEEGTPYVIDWALATWENRYVDLGYFTFVNGLTDKQSKKFLTAYFNRSPTEKEWNQFKIAQKRTSFLTATVWFDFSESAQDKTIPLCERINNLDSLLDSDKLKLGQEYISSEQIISPLSDDHEAIKLFALGFLKTYISFSTYPSSSLISLYNQK